MNLLPIERDRALVGLDGARQDLDHHRLSGTVVADHGQAFPRIEVEIAVIECGDPAEALYQASGLQNGFHHAAAFLIHWSTATAAMMSTPINR